MKKFLNSMQEALGRGENLVMVSIIASSGSAPRGAGARMLVGSGGRLCGTIGGGAIEYRSEVLAGEALRSGKSSLKSFSLSRDDVENLGMICGGAVTVHFQFISAGDSRYRALAGKALAQCDAGRDAWLVSMLDDPPEFGLYTRDEGFLYIEAPTGSEALMTRRPTRRTIAGRDIFAEQIVSSGRVYIFGGGHVAQELAPLLSHVGFRCIVLDDRAAFTAPELFRGVQETRLVDFFDIFGSVTIDPEDYAVVMTRGHAYDAAVGAQLLRTGVRYIGVIGSASKKAGTHAKLTEAGFSEADIGRIVTPIGLSIKAETPAEIAISIAGQMIAVRAGDRQWGGQDAS